MSIEEIRKIMKARKEKTVQTITVKELIVTAVGGLKFVYAEEDGPWILWSVDKENFYVSKANDPSNLGYTDMYVVSNVIKVETKLAEAEVQK